MLKKAQLTTNYLPITYSTDFIIYHKPTYIVFINKSNCGSLPGFVHVPLFLNLIC